MTGTMNNPLRCADSGKAQAAAIKAKSAIIVDIDGTLYRVHPNGDCQVVRLNDAAMLAQQKERDEKLERSRLRPIPASYAQRGSKGGSAIRRITGLVAVCLGLLVAQAADIPKHYIRALAEVETGDDDNARGPSGERTRYQILPKVWNDYSRTPIGQASPKHATDVATRILSDRWDAFQSRHGRVPTDEEVYALWHRPARVHRLTKVEAGRCERFGRVARKFKWAINGGGK